MAGGHDGAVEAGDEVCREDAREDHPEAGDGDIVEIRSLPWGRGKGVVKVRVNSRWWNTATAIVPLFYERSIGIRPCLLVSDGVSRTRCPTRILVAAVRAPIDSVAIVTIPPGASQHGILDRLRLEHGTPRRNRFRQQNIELAGLGLVSSSRLPSNRNRSRGRCLSGRRTRGIISEERRTLIRGIAVITVPWLGANRGLARVHGLQTGTDLARTV